MIPFCEKNRQKRDKIVETRKPKKYGNEQYVIDAWIDLHQEKNKNFKSCTIALPVTRCTPP
jgi:hypothetical protein